MKTRIFFAGLLPALAFCGPAEERLETAQTESEVIAANGRALNGAILNGRVLNGRVLNGRVLNGTTVNGRVLNGRVLNGLSLAGSSLMGLVSDGSTLSGADWIGAEVTIDSVDPATGANTPMPIRFDAFTADPDFGALRNVAAPDDVNLYSISALTDAGTWVPLCGSYSDGHGSHPAFANAGMFVQGAWNYTTGARVSSDPADITFTCVNGAIAKCTRLGYKTWDPARAEHNDACTRMLRADYCGDGTSYTLDGFALDISDGIGVQSASPGLTWSFEASWTPNGAACVNSARALDLIVSQDVPACVLARLSDTCTPATGFTGGILLMNSFDPWGIEVALERAYDQYPTARSELRKAMDQIDNALQKLAQSPPRERDAAGAVESAVTHLQSALNRGLDPVFGADLMRRYAKLVRAMLTNAIDNAVATGYSASKISSARSNLSTGDTRLGANAYSNAINAYKNGLGNLGR